MIDPTQDGIDHINIYSQGKTALGQYLSNWAFAPVELPEGTFDSLEGYWFYLKTGNEMFKTLSGYEAKKQGRLLGVKEHSDNTEFKYKFTSAMREKVKQHLDLLEQLRNSYLPFTHYYVMHGKVVNAGYGWIVEEWEKIRQELIE